MKPLKENDFYMKKKTNNLLKIVFLLPFLFSCENSKTLLKIKKEEDGKLINLSGEQLYNLVIVNKESSVVLFKIDDCYSCNNAFEQIEIYCQLKSCYMYCVNLSSTSESDYSYIYQATTFVDDIYAFPKYNEAITLPLVYAFLDQSVVFKIEENFIDFFDKYIQII